ncbi:MAG: secretin N-terminal domain-containing protein [Verrucomicrobiota bacterium]
MSLHRPLALFLLGLASASAQQPAGVPVPPPGVPVAGQAPPQPAGAPAVPGAQNQVPLGENKITEPIEELKLTGDALAGLYRKYTGRRVIVSTAASTAEFRFVQDASPADPLTFAEAAELLKKAAILENFVFVPDAQNPNLDVLTVATGGTNPKGIGLGVYNENGPVYSESDTLPEGDEVISYVMTLNYLKPADAQNAFVSIIGQFGSYGSITAIPNASALVITENTTLIRKLIDLKKEIDKPGGVQDTRFIKVKFADVTEIADTLTTLLTAQQSTQTTAGIQRADNNGAPPGVPQATGQPGAAAGGENIPVQIVPDPRTNRIFAMGRPVDLLFIEGLVREFDVETSEKIFLRRKLRFLAVADFLDVAEQALTRAFSGTGDGGGSAGAGAGGGAAQGGGGRAQAGGNANRQSNASRGNNSSTGGDFGNGSSGSGSFGGGGSASGGGSALDAPETNTVPEARLVGRTLLVADNITNSIVVQGPPSGLEIVERLLDQIDVKPDQVIISTVIGQLTLNDSTEFGVNYLLNEGDFKLGAGGSNGSTFIPGSSTSGGTTTSPNRFPRFDPSSLSGTGLRALGTIGDLGVYLKALSSKGNFTVLSRPSIFTANNQKGTISSGEKIAIPTSSNSFNNGGASTNIEYQDVVLKLEVIPLVNSDNDITMQIALLNDEQNGIQVIAGAGANGEALEVPKISTREILTNVTVPNNETVVLGGLIISRDNDNKGGIPILSSIPYVGALFGTHTDSKSRSELLVFLQPSVVKSARSLDAVQADFDSRYQVSGPLHELANGPGMVPDTGTPAPISDKGGESYPVTSDPSEVSGSTNLKPSIRPAFRR